MRGAMRPKLIHLTTVDFSLEALLGFQLQRFVEEGFDVVGASAPSTHVTALERNGIRHLALPALTTNWTADDDLRATAQLVRAFRRERPAIVHTHDPKSGVLGCLAARAAKVPVIVNTVAGLYDNPALSRVRRALIGRSERWAMRIAHHEFFQSEEDHDRAIGERMVDPSRASWLGSGVDLGRFDPVQVDRFAVADLRRSWGAGDGKRVVGVVGRLVREKGYAELFQAARRIREERPEALFVVVGPGEPSGADGLTRSDLSQARGAGVVFQGEVPSEDMPAAYLAFDVFVLPSHREGMPRSAIEGSAMGRPIVATDIRGCREVIIDGQTGRLVPARDPRALARAIGGLLSDPAASSALGAAARKRALERFDENAVVERTVQVYRRLLGVHGIRWDGEAP